ncbi:orotate phosphoribosyltransferase [Gammaproteobacteria bacterium]|nr:orotate phosphoribosyltransferase [Gammaproteobacteria bacterium]
MENYKQEFINFSLSQGVLKFGEFKLKSGRISPYFFNMGLFNTGSTIAKLGDFYAQALVNEEKNFDLLFGPAYKGIPIVTSLASSLSKNHNIDKPFTFNRKEVKDHGEKGQLVGAPIKGKVLIVDDVITAGTAIHEASNLISELNGEVMGILISLDRQEKGQGALSAVEEVSQKLNVPVISIVTLNDIIEYILEDGGELSQFIDQIKNYREKYGITA